MEAWRIAAAVVAGVVLGSFTDWLFMGVLFHDRYLRHPEVWREGRGETSKILVSQGLAVISCAGLAGLCVLAPRGWGADLSAAALAWLAGPLPMLAQNGVWMKIDPLVTAAHAAGWLVRFLVTGGACALLFAHA